VLRNDKDKVLKIKIVINYKHFFIKNSFLTIQKTVAAHKGQQPLFFYSPLTQNPNASPNPSRGGEMGLKIALSQIPINQSLITNQQITFPQLQV
jgi:hypothetical protein